MKVVQFPLRPMSHFHFGEIAQDNKSNMATTSAFPHSDTLFSALINSYAQTHDTNETDAFVDDFNQGKSLISSMFYYLNTGNNKVYFLPKPLTYNIQEIENKFYKQFKEIKFISVGVWEKISDTNDFFKNEVCSIIQGAFVILKDELNDLPANRVKIYHKVTQPKVPIRFIDEDATIYFETGIEIADNSAISDQIEIGYYFLYQSKEESRLKEAINLMAINGIGGGVSTGAGALSNPIFDNLSIFDFSTFSSSENYCCISLSIPKDQEDFKCFELYEATIRGGRKMEVGKQNFIRMIKEGAIVMKKAEGKLVEIGKDEQGNSVVRNGKCFILPIKEYKK